jgi:hypothetical protein
VGRGQPNLDQQDVHHLFRALQCAPKAHLQDVLVLRGTALYNQRLVLGHSGFVAQWVSKVEKHNESIWTRSNNRISVIPRVGNSWW